MVRETIPLKKDAVKCVGHLASFVKNIFEFLEVRIYYKPLCVASSLMEIDIEAEAVWESCLRHVVLCFVSYDLFLMSYIFCFNSYISRG